MTCKYENGKLVFSENTKIPDGKYVLLCNGDGSFNLYTENQFETLTEKCKKVLAAVGNGSAKNIIRYLCTNSDLVDMKNKKIEIPGVFKETIRKCHMTVIIKSEYIKIDCGDGISEVEIKAE